MNRNIYLAYFLASMKNSWFWLGIWVLYYLQFTNYAGIGILESVMIVTTTLGEIPTGAIADLIGRRKTLIMAFIFESIGGLIIAFSQNFFQLMLSVFIMCLGGALYSGTFEALVFDSLKQLKKESSYDKIIANISSITLVTIAVVSIIGGFLYPLNPRLPFIANAVFYILGLVASFWLIEPQVDTFKYSFSTYLNQTKQGFSQLFSRFNKNLTLRLLFLGGFIVILDEMLEAILLVEYGFKAQWLGTIYSIIYLVSAFSSQFTPWLKRHLSFNYILICLSLVIGLTLIISPIVGLVLGGLMVLVRYSLAPIFNNLASETVNKNTQSKYRATTISTFNMIKNLPYVLSAFFIGSLMDVVSAKTFALYLGLALLVMLITQQLWLKERQNSA